MFKCIIMFLHLPALQKMHLSKHHLPASMVATFNFLGQNSSNQKTTVHVTH